MHINFIDYRITFLGSIEMSFLNWKEMMVYELNKELKLLQQHYVIS